MSGLVQRQPQPRPVQLARGMSAKRALAIWTALGIAALVVFVASLALGSVSVAPSRVLDALLPSADASSDLATQIVRTLRLPRALAGFGCGALLALAGALLQVLLRNPLAEPYVLGVSGGAASFALVAMMAGCAWWIVDASAFAGAFVSILLVLGLARGALWRGEPQDASPRLLLTGAVIAAGWGAVITLLLTVAPDSRLRGMLFWLTGDLNGGGAPWLALAALCIALLAIVPIAPQLNVLLRGDAAAQALGVPVMRARLRVYLVASLAAAAAVTTGGTIGFVGLVVPHMLRLAFGNDQRMLLPAAALGGGVAVMGADLVARTVIAPAQLPVGVITALIGVPVFLWMLLRRRRA
ncbi:iron ABC transporter permease [Paraburkholderia caribensis]|uniref:Iron ABC transporter n=1 Tax=Paraburkholderia caribensis TaxID=75105 RepID=A0A9Q6WLV4_9BURK|nr:iron ABC transporter permease [Paraburkholderia caribensis]MCO4881244.1 iron ABC transporter permease [Paraburkholderia caribensis]MDR6386712.1 iron complex transport system permease protein [Paraburkholderia caribensis]PTB29345.1 iron ABC transporter [Paraburkholderia caribensis]QLB63347.1 iron ABC transporter [Paraburkholderia caribensis]